MSKRARGTGRVFLPQYAKGKMSRLWWIRYGCRHRCGKADCSGVHFEGSGSPKREVAERLLRKRLGDLDSGKVLNVTAEKTTFAGLEQMIRDDYAVNQRKSMPRLVANLKHLKEAFGSRLALQITTDRIKGYIKERLEAKAAPATVQNEVVTLSRMFALGLQAGKVMAKPYIPTLKFTNTRTGFFEEPDFQAVLAHLPDDLRPLMQFARLTGWRKSEMLGLTWKQVDFRAGEVRLEPGTTKNDEGKTFPFAVLPPLKTLLEEQRKRTTALEKKTEQIIPWVFHRDGTPIRDYDEAWHRACEAAGIPGRRVHDFRRTAVRALERAGVPRSVAMKLTGHKSEQVYRRYAIVSPSDLKEAVGKLAALHATPTQAASPQVVALPRRDK